MICAIVLQVLGLTTFESYIDKAALQLGLNKVKVVVSEEYPYAAWIPEELPYSPPGIFRYVVYVRRDFLSSVDRPTLEVIATHEACHVYLLAGRRGFFPGEKDLHHSMIDPCVQWALGLRYDSVMQAVSCGNWYPNEVMRYYDRTGRRRKCIETR